MLRCAAFLLLQSSLALLAAGVPGGTWEKLTDAEATAAGWSRAKLADARTFAETLHTEAVVVVTHGKILDAWGPVDRKFNVHSIRKSFLSALCGIEVKEGRLELSSTLAELGIDDNPPALTEIEKRATVHDLLKARSGIYHPALYETARMKARRPVRHSHAPGTFWYYNNWDFNAMGTIYEQVTRAGIYEQFKRRIAEPLGMQDYGVSDGSYVTGADSIHRAYPFRMTARDLARFGLLYLREGKWGEGQVVPAEWVRESVRSYSDAGSSGGYGYFWWVAKDDRHFPSVTLPEGSYSARGAGGHYIVVIPKLDLVVVHRVNTDLDGRGVESSQFGELLRRILAAHRPASAEVFPVETIEELVPRLMSKHRVPGAAIVAIADRRIAWERYFGVREAGQAAPVDARTVFEVASMTKPLLAYAALDLVEQGKLDLDRPLFGYLPERYLEGEPMHEEITARMALNHTTGFPNWRRDQPLKVLHKPGSTYSYSGEGILFLQRVVEHLTGEDYETYMQRTLLQPLKMTSSSHVWQEAFTASAAAGHDATGAVKANRKRYTQANAAYSLYTTPRDYAAFVLEMMAPERTAAHSLEAGSVKAMLTPASPPTKRKPLTRRGSESRGEPRFGLGWLIEPCASGDRVCHSGSNGTGFRSYTEFDPVAGHGLIIVTNSDSGDDLWRDLVSVIGVP